MNTYDQDHAAWAEEQARLLRMGKLDAVDIEHVAEELEAIMGNDRRELYRRFRVLIAHLLKWDYQPEHRSLSWEATIRVQRDDIANLLGESPSLKRFVTEKINAAYPKAVELASLETGLPKAGFPSSCPYTESEILDESFWPGKHP